MSATWNKVIAHGLNVALTTSIVLASPIVDARAASQAIIGTTFESVADTKSCNSSTCTVYFPAIPAGRIVRVDHAICDVSSAIDVLRAYFSPFSSAVSNSPLKSVAMKVELVYEQTLVANTYVHTVALDTPLVIGPGRFPGVTVRTVDNEGTVILTNCVISGTVISG